MTAPSKKAPAPDPSTSLGSPEVVEMRAGVFKDKCLQILDEVRDRAMEVIVTKHGKPVAKVVAPDVNLPSAFGFMRGTVLATEDIVSPDFDAWGEFV